MPLNTSAYDREDFLSSLPDLSSRKREKKEALEGARSRKGGSYNPAGLDNSRGRMEPVFNRTAGEAANAPPSQQAPITATQQDIDIAAAEDAARESMQFGGSALSPVEREMVYSNKIQLDSKRRSIEMQQALAQVQLKTYKAMEDEMSGAIGTLDEKLSAFEGRGGMNKKRMGQAEAAEYEQLSLARGELASQMAGLHGKKQEAMVAYENMAAGMTEIEAALGPEGTRLSLESSRYTKQKETEGLTDPRNTLRALKDAYDSEKGYGSNLRRDRTEISKELADSMYSMTNALAMAGKNEKDPTYLQWKDTVTLLRERERTAIEEIRTSDVKQVDLNNQMRAASQQLQQAAGLAGSGTPPPDDGGGDADAGDTEKGVNYISGLQDGARGGETEPNNNTDDTDGEGGTFTSPVRERALSMEERGRGFRQSAIGAFQGVGKASVGAERFLSGAAGFDIGQALFAPHGDPILSISQQLKTAIDEMYSKKPGTGATAPSR